eukprot:1029874-Prymnesium_polylepis.1
MAEGAGGACGRLRSLPPPSHVERRVLRAFDCTVHLCSEPWPRGQAHIFTGVSRTAVNEDSAVSRPRVCV